MYITMVQTKYCHSAALLYVNRNIDNILGATCKWFHSTSQPSMLPTVKDTKIDVAKKMNLK